MLLASWEVCVGKNYDRGLENAAFSSPWSQFLPRQTYPKPDNNMFISFSFSKLAYKWVCLHKFVIKLAFRAIYIYHLQKNQKKKNEQTSGYLLDVRCI